MPGGGVTSQKGHHRMNRRTFDLALIVVILANPAMGLARIASRRWANETPGPLAKIGDAINVGL
jgi:hypothetical protein